MHTTTATFNDRQRPTASSSISSVSFNNRDNSPAVKPLEDIYEILEGGNIQQHVDYLADRCVCDMNTHRLLRNDICLYRFAQNYHKLYQLVCKNGTFISTQVTIDMRIQVANCYSEAAKQKYKQNKELCAIMCMKMSIRLREGIICTQSNHHNLNNDHHFIPLAHDYLNLLRYYPVQNKSKQSEIRAFINNIWNIQNKISPFFSNILKAELFYLLGEKQENTFLQCNQVDSLHKALKFFNKTKKLAQKNLELYPFRMPDLYIEATTKIDHIYIAYLSHPENYQKSIKYPNKVYKLLKESMYFQENPMEVAIMFTQKGIRYYTLLESQNPKETYTYRKVIGNLNNALRYFDKAHDKKFDVVGHKKAMGTTLKDTWKIMPCKTCKLNNPTQKKRLCPCKKVVYCSKKCQKWHWKKQHRTECATYLQA